MSSSVSVQSVQKQNYYMKALEYYLNVNASENKTAKLYQEHFLETFASLKYVNKLRMPTDEAMASIRINCADINQVGVKS